MRKAERRVVFLRTVTLSFEEHGTGRTQRTGMVHRGRAYLPVCREALLAGQNHKKRFEPQWPLLNNEEQALIT
jgi:hypothetical protein